MDARVPLMTVSLSRAAVGCIVDAGRARNSSGQFCGRENQYTPARIRPIGNGTSKCVSS